MRVQGIGFAAVVATLALSPGTASACHKCKQTPCAYAPAPVAYAPPYQCVTEMVPYTVMRTRTRIDYRPETVTVMANELETTWTERQRVVCKPVMDTTTVQRVVNVCKPVFQTDYVTQHVTVCRPVSTTRQITEMCMQPITQLVTVPVAAAGGKCGRCGHPRPSCGCQTVAQTTFTAVPVVRDVVETRMIPEVQTRQVPVTRCTIVREQKVIDVPVVSMRVVQEVVNERIPHVSVRCVPKTMTRQIPFPVCETVAETCYRPVTRMVPVSYPAPQAVPTVPMAPSGQSGPSAQH